MINPVKEKLKRGERVIGCFIGMYAPNIVEMIGYSEYDFVVIDDEHGAFSTPELENMIRTAESVNLVPIVRVSYDPSSIQKALDRGALGIQVPMVNTIEDAERAVEMAKFPPLGKRGAAYSHRAARFGMDKGKAFLDQSDDSILVIPHIETKEAAENFKEIMDVEGIDLAFLGTTDLSVNMNYKEEGPKHSEVQKVVDGLYQVAKENNYRIGTVAGDAEGAQKAFDEGADYVGIIGVSVMVRAFKDVKEASIRKLEEKV